MTEYVSLPVGAPCWCDDNTQPVCNRECADSVHCREAVAYAFHLQEQVRTLSEALVEIRDKGSAQDRSIAAVALGKAAAAGIDHLQRPSR